MAEVFELLEYVITPGMADQDHLAKRALLEVGSPVIPMYKFGK